MCAEGLLLADVEGLGAALQAESRERLAAGPPPASATETEDRRYALTDTLDDLRGCTDPWERTYLVADLLQRASELALLTGGHWLGGGKWLSRRLAEADPELHGRLTAGAAAEMSGSPGEEGVFADVVKEVLEAAGGPCGPGTSAARAGAGKTVVRRTRTVGVAGQSLPFVHSHAGVGSQPGKRRPCARRDSQHVPLRVLRVPDQYCLGANSDLYAVATAATAVAALEPDKFSSAHSAPRICSSRLVVA